MRGNAVSDFTLISAVCLTLHAPLVREVSALARLQPSAGDAPPAS
jgi:hypothetical protein